MGDIRSDVEDTTPSSDKRFWPGLAQSFKQQAAIYIVTAVFAILTVFSNTIADRIKTALNYADAREDRYATLARQISGYIFDCELIEEYLVNGWTTRDALVPIISDYNKDITDLRRNEYVNRAMLAKYWNKARRNQFDSLMAQILKVDSTVHKLNDEYEKVNILKTEAKVGPTRASANSAELHNLLATFKPEAENFLGDLD
jgi:hypothetical protein